MDKDRINFIKERTMNSIRRGSNCLGTALYLSGEISIEKYFSRENAKTRLFNLENSPKPEIGYIALWQLYGQPFHAGIISEENPFKILHRKNKNDLLVQDFLDEFTNNLYNLTRIKPVYKIPSKFNFF